MEITIDNLNVVLGEKAILNNTTIAFAHGLLTGIIGPNGSGKSTLLKCIYRVFKPQSGAIFLDGAPLESYGVRQTAQKQAVLAQHNYNNFDFDVIDVVLMGRSPYKSAMESDNEEDYAIAMESLRTVGRICRAELQRLIWWGTTKGNACKSLDATNRMLNS